MKNKITIKKLKNKRNNYQWELAPPNGRVYLFATFTEAFEFIDWRCNNEEGELWVDVEPCS